MAYQDKLTGMVNSIAGSIGQLAISQAVKGQKEATEAQTKSQENIAKQEEEFRVLQEEENTIGKQYRDLLKEGEEGYFSSSPIQEEYSKINDFDQAAVYRELKAREASQYALDRINRMMLNSNQINPSMKMYVAYRAGKIDKKAYIESVKELNKAYYTDQYKGLSKSFLTDDDAIEHYETNYKPIVDKYLKKGGKE